MIESKNDSSRNRDQFDVETEKDFLLKPRRLHLYIENKHSQQPFLNQTDFDLGFENLDHF